MFGSKSELYVISMFGSKSELHVMPEITYVKEYQDWLCQLIVSHLLVVPQPQVNYAGIDPALIMYYTLPVILMQITISAVINNWKVMLV